MSALTLLTVLNDAARAEMYRRLAEGSGLEVMQADGPLHALTQLERTRVNAVICDEQLEDMSGQELCAILADDAATRRLPVYLLPPPCAPGAAPGGATLCGPEVLRLAMSQLGAPVAQAAAPVGEHPPQLQGELAPFALPDFLHWLSELGYSGHWLLRVRPAPGTLLSAHVAMSGGQLCYAEFAGRSGKAALRELLRATQEAGGADFRYYHQPDFQLSHTEDFVLSTPRLLIELAVDLDEEQLALTPAGYAPTPDRSTAIRTTQDSA